MPAKSEKKTARHDFMKITVAIDSFKGSITSTEAAYAVRAAALSFGQSTEIKTFALADGGEGTVEAFLAALGGRKYSESVVGPLGEEVIAEYGISEDGTAIIEMSSAAGLPLVPADKRNPGYTTTFGVGQLILAAIAKGSRKFIVGLGGSATNDGGAGMLSALGYKLLDGEGRKIPLGAVGLSRLERINSSGVIPELSECSFLAACDVKNPLLGKNGASAVFGPQKGADSKSVELLDSWLSRFAAVSEEYLCVSHRNDEGAGAAGGLGFALISYLGAELRSGIDLLINLSNIEEEIRTSDLVITGEGRLDGQTVMGKAPVGIAALAKKHGKPVIAFCGCVGNGASSCNCAGIDAYFPIIQGPCTLSEALDKHTATENLKRTAEQAIRLFACAGRITNNC